MEENPELVRYAIDGRLSPQKEAQRWSEIADRLNLLVPAKKDSKTWRALCNTKACEAMAHDTRLPTASRKTGGGPCYEDPLAVFEE